jgi:hypothetical protein
MQALTQRHNFLSLSFAWQRCINNKTALMTCENGLFCALLYDLFQEKEEEEWRNQEDNHTL